MTACKCTCGGSLRTLETRGDERRRQCVDCGKKFITKEAILREVATQRAARAKVVVTNRCRRVRKESDTGFQMIPPTTAAEKEHGKARRRVEDILLARELGISVEELA